MTSPPLHFVTRILLVTGVALLSLGTGFLMGLRREQPGGTLQLHDIEDRHCMETLVRELEAWPKCRK